MGTANSSALILQKIDKYINRRRRRQRELTESRAVPQPLEISKIRSIGQLKKRILS